MSAVTEPRTPRLSANTRRRLTHGGFIAIAFLLKYVRTHSFRPFVIYRIAVGLFVIAIFATGIR